jgi:hypothetical protein
MIETKNLKIWTIVAHALIIIGMGHGILCFAILEILGIAELITQLFTLHSSYLLNSMSPAIFFIVVGQIAIILSLFNKNKLYKTIFHLLGIIFLWASIIFYIDFVNKEEGAAFLTVTALPFTICTIKIFLGKSIKKFFDWLLEREVSD